MVVLVMERALMNYSISLIAPTDGLSTSVKINSEIN